MEPNVLVGAAIGAVVLATLPGFLNAFAMRKLRKDDEKEATERQRIHDAFASAAAELRDERSKRENLERQVSDIRVAMAEAMKKEDLDGLYQRVERIEAGVKEDMRDFGRQVNETMQKVIVALASRPGGSI